MTLPTEKFPSDLEIARRAKLRPLPKIAGEIQARLLPITPPKVEGWDLSGVSLP